MKPRFQLLIEAQPQADDESGVRRLRAALKSMLRRHGLKCVSATPVADAQSAGEAIADQTPTAANAERIAPRRPTVTENVTSQPPY
jgi:hypothetical protein